MISQFSHTANSALAALVTGNIGIAPIAYTSRIAILGPIGLSWMGPFVEKREGQ